MIPEFLIYVKPQLIHLEPVCGLFHVPFYLLLRILTAPSLSPFYLSPQVRFSTVGSLGFCDLLMHGIMDWKGLQGRVSFCLRVVGPQPCHGRENDIFLRMQICRKCSKTGNSETCKGLFLFNSKSRCSDISQGQNMGLEKFLNLKSKVDWFANV